LVFVFIGFLLWIEFRRRPKQFDRPWLLDWKVSYGLLLLHPANAVVDLHQGNAKTPR
jgi:hypothetical protein